VLSICPRYRPAYAPDGNRICAIWREYDRLDQLCRAIEGSASQSIRGGCPKTVVPAGSA